MRCNARGEAMVAEPIYDNPASLREIKDLLGPSEQILGICSGTWYSAGKNEHDLVVEILGVTVNRLIIKSSRTSRIESVPFRTIDRLVLANYGYECALKHEQYKLTIYSAGRELCNVAHHDRDFIREISNLISEHW
jgi:hypothetical protein